MAKAQDKRIFRWEDVGSAIGLGIIFFFVFPYVRFNSIGWEYLDVPDHYSLNSKLIWSLFNVFVLLIGFLFVRSIRYVWYVSKDKRIKDYGE